MSINIYGSGWKLDMFYSITISRLNSLPLSRTGLWNINVGGTLTK